MGSDPYARFRNEEFILRDYLAADRTVLANERTLLSSVRTAAAFAGAGTALIHFFDSLGIEILGWTMIPVAVSTLVVGVLRYAAMRRRLGRILDSKKRGSGIGHGVTPRTNLVSCFLSLSGFHYYE